MLATRLDGAENLNFPTRGVAPPIEPGCDERRALIRSGCDPPQPVALPFANTKGEAYDNREESWRRKSR